MSNDDDTTKVTHLPVEHPEHPQCPSCRRLMPTFPNMVLLIPRTDLEGCSLETLTFKLRCSCGIALILENDPEEFLISPGDVALKINGEEILPADPSHDSTSDILSDPVHGEFARDVLSEAIETGQRVRKTHTTERGTYSYECEVRLLNPARD